MRLSRQSPAILDDTVARGALLGGARMKPTMRARGSTEVVPGMTRRHFLRATTAAAAAAAAWGPLPFARAADEVAGAAAGAAGRKRVLRLAHLTDVHVQPERG